jgi:regulatory protein
VAKITDILPQIKDKTRVNVYLDGKFYCGMDLVTVLSNRLKAGMEISEEKLGEMQRLSEEERALSKAMHYLTGSMKTEKEVADYLAKKGYTPTLVAAVIERLVDYAFLNDTEYAKEYAESYAAKKGARLIALELRQKGISQQDISAALTDFSEEEGATSTLKKYLRGKEVTRETLQKAYRYLLSKGFSGETVTSALKRYGVEEDK